MLKQATDLHNIQNAHPLFAFLGLREKEHAQKISSRFRFSFQEMRSLIEWSRDLEMWGEVSLEKRTEEILLQMPESWDTAQQKKKLFESLRAQVQQLRDHPKSYDAFSPKKVPAAELKIEIAKSDKEIFGQCPVASPKTVCCNLKTIDAAENCAFGCSYCTIQTFYGEAVRFDADFGEKLKKIQLEPGRFYHIGTGQASDSLVWGNRNGILDDLCAFAASHPKILLELKTKSANIAYFMDHTIPKNLVISWSLNSEAIVQNEEHHTASLAKRLESARKVADRGIGVAFHFHPMVHYAGWEVDYPEIAIKLRGMFKPEEVIFISMGSITMIKPVMQEIRKKNHATKILQMPLVPDPHGKLTYPDEIKTKLFSTLLNAFGPWREGVYFYLCMEKAEIWDQVFGSHYPTNEEFELDFGKKTFAKL